MANRLNKFVLVDAERHAARLRQRCARKAFTLVEVLATLLLLAIALPCVMQGFSLANSAAFKSRRQNEASALAESKLNELVGTGAWQTGASSGDFGADWPEYTWSCAVNSWGTATGVDGTNTSQQLDVTVTWKSGGKDESYTVSTLVYQSANATSSATTGGSS